MASRFGTRIIVKRSKLFGTRSNVTIPKHFGWDWAPDDGPRFQLAPIGERGYIEGLPVREYKS
jgi:hypothetical protein